MTISEKKEAVHQFIVRAVPSVMDLKMGCEIKSIFWYKTEEDKKAGKIDWRQSGIEEDGKRGVVVKDLRSEYLPMWIDYGDQLEFEIAPDDIVSFEIIGRPITLATVIHALDQVLTEDKIKEVMQLTKYNAMTLVSNLVHLWNCADDDFDHQSEAVWEFLWSLLCE